MGNSGTQIIRERARRERDPNGETDRGEGGEEGGITGEADVDDEGAALVGRVLGAGDGAGEVGDGGAVVQRDGDAGDLPVAIALRELLLHARDVHHRRRFSRRRSSAVTRLYSLLLGGSNRLGRR